MESKICPLLTAGAITTGELFIKIMSKAKEGDMGFDCIKEKCAWWMLCDRCCAITRIATK